MTQRQHFPYVSYATALIGLATLVLATACNNTQPLVYQRLPIRLGACEIEDSRYDGRFSLGSNGENLTYSWFGDEATWVTSHFVVRLYDKKGAFHGHPDKQDFFASNYPLVSKTSKHDLNLYLRGNLELYGSQDAPKSITSYEVSGVEIRQELTPMRHNFRELNSYRQRPTIYQVKYVLTNTDSMDNRIGFQVRLDPKLRRADTCVLEPFKHRRSIGKISNVLDKVPDTLDRNVTTLVHNNRWAQNYNGIRIHGSQQVNRNAPMGFVYTGNRKKDLQPERIILSDWNTQRGELWSKPTAQKKYSDSGMILEWQVDLKPGESQELTYYYGWYFPSWGKRLFTGLVKPNAVQLQHQGPVDYLDNTYFSLAQDSVWIGDSVRAEWSIAHEACCPDKLDRLVSNVDQLDYYGGDAWVAAACKNEEFFMNLRVEKSKVYASFHDTLFVNLPRPPKDKDAFTTGLFTLGAGNQSLLFGYPYPSTSSYFVLNSENVEKGTPIAISGRGASRGEARMATSDSIRGNVAPTSFYASNDPEVIQGVKLLPQQTLSPEYPTDQMEWIKGFPLDIKGRLMYPVARGVDSVFIEQRITPCDANMIGDPDLKTPAYYRVDYIVRNASCTQTRRFDLGYLLDPRLGGDEMGQIQVNDSVYTTKESFYVRYPRRLNILPAPEDSLVGMELLFGVGGTPRPDTVFNTLWQAQRRRVSGIREDLTILDDRALFLQWGAQTLAPTEKAYYSFAIGNTQGQPMDLVYTQSPRNQTALWFDFDRDTLIQGEVRVLREVFDTFRQVRRDSTGKVIPSYSHVVLEGFTGSLGSEYYNRDLAQRRLDHIADWLMLWGVEQEKILTKLNGEYYASDQPRRQQIRNSERVVVMKVY